MFLHTFKNTFKILIRQKELMFWGLLFPLVLAVFFKLAMGNITSSVEFKLIPVAVNENIQDANMKLFFDNLEGEYFDVIKVDNVNKALEDKKIVAYIDFKENKPTAVMTKSGIQETIVESVLDAYVQNSATITRIMSQNPQANIGELLGFNEFVVDQTNENMDLVNTYFYTLVGMQAMYGYMWGMSVIYNYEANLSTQARRNVISPIHKMKSLLSALLVAWIINTSIILILMAFCRFVLKVDFGDKTGYVMLLVIMAALCGVSFGTLLGSSNKKSIDTKVGIGISVTMMLSFLAGMMVAQMKIFIQRFAPMVNWFNPVALITDGLYSLYYYATMDRYWFNIGMLGLVTLIFVGLTFYFIRGKQYDSL